jgi:nucleotide-binding universal stress UspA family protein
MAFHRIHFLANETPSSKSLNHFIYKKTHSTNLFYMKHAILFPTDFSTASEKVFGHAARLANELDAPLHILHVYHYQMPSADVVPQGIRDAVKVESEDEALQHMLNYVDELHEKAGMNVDVNTIFKTGFAADEIPVIASELGATIIVMGATGASGGLNEVIGTVASAVIERAPCPVLAVPPDRAAEGVWKMTFASSFRENEVEYFRKVERLARDLGMRIAVVHVQKEKPAAAFEENHSYFVQKERDGEVDYVLLQHEVPADGLKSYLAQYPVDILALNLRRLPNGKD